ncbi:MAG: glycosyltransferase, partial [Muribaculaceae bacterium]|nr:glycosyltransferase [Muribaculaceae bacterium]
MNRNPLVSIPIITYNSASYILDGLESIKEQTYKNIEIIISDDCSTDQTIEICQNWIDVNQHLFERAIIVTSEINTGVAGNLNRAIRECKGEWIRCLSGDDRFYPNTISDYVDFVKANTNINICFGKLKFIHQHSKLNETIINNYRKHFEEIKNQRKQYIR